MSPKTRADTLAARETVYVNCGHPMRCKSTKLDMSTRTGWTIGAGLDYALTGHVIVGAEYLYADYGAPKITTMTLSTRM
jgi:opacity protein-like surface antigen